MNKKITSALIISIAFLALSSNSIASENRTNYLATPSSSVIYTDEEFMKIRLDQEERLKKQEAYIEKAQNQKEQEQKKLKIGLLEKDYYAQINHIKDMVIAGDDRCSIYTNKTYMSLGSKLYEINKIKESVNIQTPQTTKKYFLDKQSNTCVEKNTSIGIGFNSMSDCNFCINGGEIQKATTTKASAVKTSIKNPLTQNYSKAQQKTGKIYSDASLSIIADNILKNKNLKEVKELQTRTLNLIKTLKYGNVNINPTTKTNFYNLLLILNKKNSIKIMQEEIKMQDTININGIIHKTTEVKNTIKIEENNNSDDDIGNLLKDIFKD